MTFEIKKLSEVCRLINGRAYKKHEMLSEGKYPLLRVGNFFTNRGWFYSDLELDDDKYCDDGDLLYAWSASFGPRIWSGSKVIYHYHIWKIDLNTDLVDKGYLYHLLDWDTEQIKSEQGTGSTMIHVTKGAMENRRLPFPSIPEQKRIVSILDQAFADIEQARAKTEQNLKNARELYDSCLNDRLLKVCEDMPVNKLSEITELIVDCEHKTAPTQDEGFPSIRTPNIGKGNLLFDNVRRVSEETYKLWTKRAIPEPGDLILAREAPAGNVGVVPEGEKVCLGQRTVLIRPRSDVVDSQYLAFLLLHPIMQERLLAHSTGATVQHVNMKDIRQLGISKLPSIDDQVIDADVLLELKKQVSCLEQVYKNKLEAVDELKKSILQKAFSGELTKENKGVTA